MTTSMQHLAGCSVRWKAVGEHVRGFVTGLALLALLFQGLLPAVYNAAQRRADPDTMVICTAFGLEKISLAKAAQDGQAPKAAKPECPICLSAQSLPALLPPVVMALQHPLLLEILRFSLWRNAPPGQDAEPPLRARGPPAFS